MKQRIISVWKQKAENNNQNSKNKNELKNNEDSSRILWDNINCNNIHTIVVYEEKRENNGLRTYFKK